MTALTWTDDRVEKLKRLWEDGLSASQIAAELGHITRNAVIGKVHRLGLSGRTKGPPSPQVAKMRSAKKRASRPRISFGSLSPFVGNTALAHAAQVEAEEALTSFDNVTPMHQRCTLLELNSTTCRWPIGDPQSPDFSFCGGKAKEKDPYCAHHMRAAHEHDPDRTRRPRKR